MRTGREGGSERGREGERVREEGREQGRKGGRKEEGEYRREGGEWVCEEEDEIQKSHYTHLLLKEVKEYYIPATLLYPYTTGMYIGYGWIIVSHTSISFLVL